MSLRRRFEIGRKIVENHGLTPLLFFFPKFFGRKIVLITQVPQIRAKSYYLVQIFIYSLLNYYKFLLVIRLSRRINRVDKTNSAITPMWTEQYRGVNAPSQPSLTHTKLFWLQFVRQNNRYTIDGTSVETLFGCGGWVVLFIPQNVIENLKQPLPSPDGWVNRDIEHLVEFCKIFLNPEKTRKKFEFFFPKQLPHRTINPG